MAVCKLDQNARLRRGKLVSHGLFDLLGILQLRKVSSPSGAPQAQLEMLARPEGAPFTISDASFGGSFTLADPAPVRVDIPVDRPGIAVSLSKTVSRPRALPGDVVIYTVRLANVDTLGAKRDVVLTDVPSEWLRLRRDTVRVDGELTPDLIEVSEDGRELTLRFDEIAVGGSHVVTYAMAVRADAPAGQALNRAQTIDSRGRTTVTSAVLTIDRETIGSRMTLIGRVTEGSCLLEEDRRGIPGVRVMLEDGSFALTDADGRYHFEGLLPGTHVVQAQRQTLPEGGKFVDCSRSTRNAGSVDSRFVRGQGGSLVVADFHAVLPAGWEPPVASIDEEPRGDAEAAGAETDWLTMGDGPAGFLFPEIDHNPRAPAVRVVIRHEVDESVELLANGEPVDLLSFDGSRKAQDNTFAISTWRGIPIEQEVTVLQASLRDADGNQTATFERVVNFAAAPARAELLVERSKLTADGASNPVIAVRITDRRGRPVRSGVSGQVAINAPYESAAVLANLQQQQASGIGSTAPTWTIDGDEGIALIELAPTMVSGPLHLEFTFADGQLSRRQEIDSWIVPGDQEWTLVGLVEGSVGSRTIADNMEQAGDFDSDLGENARVAFYAKGRVLGRFLLTAAYDSASQEAEERLTGAIDPNAYYSVFADGSVRQFDAASRERLYVRIESDTFYAIYGDFETGFDQTELARYNRSATGIKAEGRFGAVHVQGFATETETRYRRDEIQGNGLTGPYGLTTDGGSVQPALGGSFVTYYTSTVGGIAPSLLMNMDNSAYDVDDKVTLNIALGRRVTNLRFSLGDIDRNTFRDAAEVYYDTGDGNWRNAADVGAYWSLGGGNVGRRDNSVMNGWGQYGEFFRHFEREFQFRSDPGRENPDRLFQLRRIGRSDGADHGCIAAYLRCRNRRGPVAQQELADLQSIQRQSGNIQADRNQFHGLVRNDERRAGPRRAASRI